VTPSELARVNRRLVRLGLAPLRPSPEHERLEAAAKRAAARDGIRIRRTFGAVLRVR
jgi:hypothetical protein